MFSDAHLFQAHQTSNLKKKQDAVGPTLVNIDKSETNSLQSDQSSSATNDVRCTSESVQVIKVEGSNRLCSRGAASPNVMLVSIAAVFKASFYEYTRAAPSIRRVVKKTETTTSK